LLSVDKDQLFVIAGELPILVVTVVSSDPMKLSQLIYRSVSLLLHLRMRLGECDKLDALGESPSNDNITVLESSMGFLVSETCQPVGGVGAFELGVE
jgi:hypothetical protein